MQYAEFERILPTVCKTKAFLFSCCPFSLSAVAGLAWSVLSWSSVLLCRSLQIMLISICNACYLMDWRFNTSWIALIFGCAHGLLQIIVVIGDHLPVLISTSSQGLSCAYLSETSSSEWTDNAFYQGSVSVARASLVQHMRPSMVISIGL